LDSSDPVRNFLASEKDLSEYALQDVSDSDMVGITTQNEVNQNHKTFGISFRRKNQLSAGMIWSASVKFRSLTLDLTPWTLVVTVHSVKMPTAFGKHAIKSIGRPLSLMTQLKKESW